MSEHLARLPEDQPAVCTCFAASLGRPHKPYCAMADLVPGYGDSGDGQADAADQARWDGRR
jgi:hypothetical protein